jgi:hypothetical protein
MTDVIEERLRSAADQAMTGVELAPPASNDAVAPPRRHRWWVTAAAGIAAAAVLGVVVWAAALRDPGPTEPVQPSPDAPAQVRARAAVEATLAAPQWRAEVSGGVTPFELWFREPDRVGSVNGSEDEPIRSIQIGETIYFRNDGEWARSGIPERPLTLISDHLGLLQGILSDGPCFADQGEFIVAWQDPETGCGSSTTALADDLPAGSDIWVLRIDDDGRVGELVVGEVPGAVGSEREELVPWPPSPSDGIDRPMRSAGGQPAFIYSFTYDDVPPITAPERFATDDTVDPSDSNALQQCEQAVREPEYARISARVVAAYDTTIAAAYAWRDELVNDTAETAGVGDPDNKFATNLPVDDLARTDPEAPVALCYVDGNFQNPRPPGASVLDRSTFIVAEGGRVVTLVGGASADTPSGPAMTPERP